MFFPKNPDQGDLIPDSPKFIKRADKTDAEIIESVASLLLERINKISSWYYIKRRSKRIIGTFLLFSAITASTIAGLIPILPGDFIPVEFSSISLAFATFFILIDKLGCFTASWQRYIIAAQKINKLSDKYHFFCLEYLTRSKHVDDTFFKESKILIERVHDIVESETTQWNNELMKTLNQIKEGDHTRSKEH